MALVDALATTETQALYAQLQAAQGNYIYFGQECFNRCNYGNGGVDSYLVTGKYPYFLEERWGTNSIILGHDLADTDVQDEAIRGFKRHYRNGGFCGIMIDSFNVSSFTAAGPNDATKILDGGVDRAAYLASVDLFIAFCHLLVDDNGNPIPLIIRPYFENDAGWAWWGFTGFTTAYYIAIFQDFVDYVISQNDHQMLFTYAPSWQHNGTASEDRYPGDSHIDIICSDNYNSNGDMSGVMYWHQKGYEFSVAHSKVYAIAEGLRSIDEYPKSDYWTDGLMDPLITALPIETASYADTEETELFNHSTTGSYVETAPADGNFSYADGVATIEIVTASTYWYIRYGKTFSQVAEKMYKFTFTISATSNRNIKVNFQQVASPYDLYHDFTVAITTTPTEYSCYYFGKATVNTTCRFFVGDILGTVTIEDFSLVEYAGPVVWNIKPAYMNVWRGGYMGASKRWEFGLDSTRADAADYLTMSAYDEVKLLAYRGADVNNAEVNYASIG